MTDDVSIPNPFLAKLRRGEIASSCLVKLIRTVEAPGILSVSLSIVLLPLHSVQLNTPAIRPHK